jgi:A/G-specific adenine glycosylase
LPPPPVARTRVSKHEDSLFVAEDVDTVSLTGETLLKEIPAAATDLRWVPTGRLPQLPLTGLARKTLQRLGLMVVPKLQIS